MTLTVEPGDRFYVCDKESDGALPYREYKRREKDFLDLCWRLMEEVGGEGFKYTSYSGIWIHFEGDEKPLHWGHVRYEGERPAWRPEKTSRYRRRLFKRMEGLQPPDYYETMTLGLLGRDIEIEVCDPMVVKLGVSYHVIGNEVWYRVPASLSGEVESGLRHCLRKVPASAYLRAVEESDDE